MKAGVESFQSFVKLPVTGVGDFATWASLLVSYGDQTRMGTACDGVTVITPARAQALKAAGYKYVGRYLYNPSSTSLPEKQIQPGELATIKEAGLRCFPIFQTWSRSADYFSYNQGTSDAFKAIEWAQYHGFKPGTIIYFAVDYDAMDGEVTQYIVPHFRGVMRTIGENSGYGVGVYGPRNVCQRIADAGYSATSMVSDMSSGFSGNLGYPMPTNWAFDQIATLTVGSGTSGSIEIDKNVASGRDTGQGDFDAGSYTNDLDVDMNNSAYRIPMLKDVQNYMMSIGVPETGGDGWTDRDWATLGGISTTKAYDLVLSADWLFTSLARQLKLRKALIQAPVMWELRKLNPLDFVADEAVKAGLKDDCSTGWGQIFAWVTIDARNYCLQQGIINGTPLSKTTDVRAVWNDLQDPTYNIRSVAYLTLYNAYQLGAARPSLTTSPAETQALLARYNGTGDKAAQYGREVLGLYNVLENYNKLSRSK